MKEIDASGESPFWRKVKTGCVSVEGEEETAFPERNGVACWRSNDYDLQSTQRVSEQLN